MLAFHGKQFIKKIYLHRVKTHAKADEISQDVYYWQDGKGCAVGCTIHSSNYAQYEIELGIPKIIARLEDRIFEGLPLELAKTWPERFLIAIKTGADLSLVWDKFASRLLTDPIGGVIQYAKTPKQLEVIQRVSDLYEAQIIGLEVPEDIWQEASNAANVAYINASLLMPHNAVYTAFAISDFYSPSVSGVDSAARAAFDAYTAPASAIEKAYIWQSELLLELLKEAK